MSKILTGNHRLLKNLNSNVILNLVRTKAPISGASLAKLTGMRPSTVQNILKSLETEGLVLKIGIGDSTKLGGRRPTLWKIRGDYGHVVGIQLEVNEIQAVLVDLNSQIIAEQKINIKKFNSLSDIENKTVEIIDIIHNVKRTNRRHLLGVGIGVSGLVDISNGVIIKTSLLSSSQQPIHLERSLKKHFDVPIYIENDANAAALAEKWFGNAKGKSNIIFTLLVVDRDVFGIGFGLILNDNIYRGANMFAGESDLFALNIKKILRRDCKLKEGNFTIGNQSIDINELQLHHLLKALEDGNDDVVRFFHETGKIIGEVLVSVINLLDPQMIVIGGEISNAREYLLESIRNTVQEKSWLTIDRKFQIVESALSSHSVALGAATIILQKIFQGPIKDKKAVIIDL